MFCPYCGKSVHCDMEEDGSRLIHGHQDSSGICGGSGLLIPSPRTENPLAGGSMPTPEDDIPAPTDEDPEQAGGIPDRSPDHEAD